MSQPLLFLRYTVALSHLTLFRDELRQFPSFQQAFIDERLEASARPLVDLVALEVGSTHFCKIAAMGVTIELQNLGDAELCREIAVGIEHALSEKAGEWRVSVAGSRETENWDLRVEGPNGFERTYTLSGAAGQHGPEAIRKMILQLVSS